MMRTLMVFLREGNVGSQYLTVVIRLHNLLWTCALEEEMN
jgi:hypothetical protein